MTSLTIVVTAYKATETIERAVRSVFGQPGLSMKVIVVIDDVCGVTEQIVRKIDENVTLIVNDRNRGAQFSRNAGLAAVTSPYVMFLDGDDYVTGDLLCALIAAMEGMEADIGFGPWLFLNEDAGICERTVPTFASPSAAFEDWLLHGRWVPPCSVAWRTAFVRLIGGWDEALKRNQDGEIVLRGLLSGARICTTRSGAGVYFQHDSEHRITRMTSNRHSLVDAAEKLAAMESDVLPIARRRHIIAKYLYTVAAQSFRRGDIVLGRRALLQSRQLGFLGHRGSRIAKTGSTFLGVQGYQRATQLLRLRF